MVVTNRLLVVLANLSHEPCMLPARPRDVQTLLWMLQYQKKCDLSNTPCKMSILCTWISKAVRLDTLNGYFFYLYIILSPFCPSTTLLWKFLNVVIAFFSYCLLCVICVLHFSINMNIHLLRKWFKFCFCRLSKGQSIYIYVNCDIALI